MPPSNYSAVCCAALLALALPAAAAAQDDVISTDRPDFVESSNVVGKGRLQIETSLAFDSTREGAGRARATATPTLLRLGVADDVELRLETDGRSRQWGGGGPVVRGMADLSAGVKWHLRDGDEAGRAALAVLAHLDLPTGARALRADGARPSLRVVAEWELPGDMSLGLMPGLASERNAVGRRFTSALVGVVVGKELTPAWRSFVELSAPRIARGRDGGTQLSLDLGAAYLVNRQCQIDAAVSRGLNRNSADYSVTVGLSVKL